MNYSFLPENSELGDYGSPGLTTTHIIYGSCDGFVALLIVLGNLLIIVAFWNEPAIRTITNAFIFSLSIADLLVGLVGIPVYLYSMVTQQPGNLYSCLVINVWIMMLTTVSIMHLLAVSYDRFLVIVRRSMDAHVTKKRRALILIAGAWTTGIVIGLLPVMGWNKGHPPVPRCVFIEIMDMRYLMFIFFATLMAPTLFMAVFYYAIYRTVHQHSNKMANMTTDNSKQARRQEHRRKKVIFSLFIVIVTFLIGWYPLYTLNAITFYCPNCSISMIWFYITIVISHLTSAINPVIYAWTMPGFSQAFMKVLKGQIGVKYRTVGLMRHTSGNLRNATSPKTTPLFQHVCMLGMLPLDLPARQRSQHFALSRAPETTLWTRTTSRLQTVSTPLRRASDFLRRGSTPAVPNQMVDRARLLHLASSSSLEKASLVLKRLPIRNSKTAPQNKSYHSLIHADVDVQASEEQGEAQALLPHNCQRIHQVVMFSEDTQVVFQLEDSDQESVHL